MYILPQGVGFSEKSWRTASLVLCSLWSYFVTITDLLNRYWPTSQNFFRLTETKLLPCESETLNFCIWVLKFFFLHVCVCVCAIRARWAEKLESRWLEGWCRRRWLDRFSPYRKGLGFFDILLFLLLSSSSKLAVNQKHVWHHVSSQEEGLKLQRGEALSGGSLCRPAKGTSSAALLMAAQRGSLCASGVKKTASKDVRTKAAFRKCST